MIQSILCVCSGNVFRSQVFEALIKRELDKSGVQDIRVESAGIKKEMAGMPVSNDAIRLLTPLGIDIKDHQSRWIGNLNVCEFDLILCMDVKIRDQLFIMKSGRKPIIKIRSSTKLCVVNYRNGGVPDTQGKDFTAHQESFEVLQKEARRICKNIFHKIRCSAH